MTIQNAFLTLAEIAQILGVPLNLINTMADASRFPSELIYLTKHAWIQDVQQALEQRAAKLADYDAWLSSLTEGDTAK